MKRFFGKSMAIEVQQILQWHLVMSIAQIPEKKFKSLFKDVILKHVMKSAVHEINCTIFLLLKLCTALIK